MRLRDIIENYENLPDEDMFGGYGDCTQCGRFVRQEDVPPLFQCASGGCYNVTHFSCMLPRQEDIYKYEIADPGVTTHFSSRWALLRRKKRKLASDDVHDSVWCPDCVVKMMNDWSSLSKSDPNWKASEGPWRHPVSESYDGLPDEDEFNGEEEEWDIEGDWCYDHNCHVNVCHAYHDPMGSEYSEVILAWLREHKAVPVSPDTDPNNVRFVVGDTDVTEKFIAELRSEFDGFKVVEPGHPAKIIIYSADGFDTAEFDGVEWKRGFDRESYENP